MGATARAVVDAAVDWSLRTGDYDYWVPRVSAVLERHGLRSVAKPAAGFNATYPVFVCGDVVVKFFGYHPSWAESYAAELAAYKRSDVEPRLMAPSLLAVGELTPEGATPWPYLIFTTVPGASVASAALTAEQSIGLARAVGEQVRCLHTLPIGAAAASPDWAVPSIATAACKSSLPLHLAAQACDFVASVQPGEAVFTHGDLCAQHVFVQNGELSGIIDWGDAMVADRHYELIQIFRDLLACDQQLFRVFLDASDWPVGSDFARRTLAFALKRQALGLAQHWSMDVFEPIAKRWPLDEFATLDELANALFSVSE